MTDELRAELEALARKDKRSLAGYAEIVLREHVEGKKKKRQARRQEEVTYERAMAAAR